MSLVPNTQPLGCMWPVNPLVAVHGLLGTQSGTGTASVFQHPALKERLYCGWCYLCMCWVSDQQWVGGQPFQCHDTQYEGG